MSAFGFGFFYLVLFWAVPFNDRPSALGCAHATTASPHPMVATAKRINMKKDNKENFNDVLARELEKFKANIKTITKDEEFYEKARRENIKAAIEPVSVPPLPGDRDE